MNQNGRLILIVEDHLSIAEMLGGYFESGGYEVDYARDGAEALRLSANNPYDAILLDRNLPRIDGVEVCRRIRQEQRRSTPILMLTARDTVQDRVEGLEAGADDYLTKPFSIEELEARLRGLMRRSRKTAGEPIRVGDLVLDPHAMSAERGGTAIHLTPIGFQILHLLMREAPRVVSREEIQREVWRDEPPDSDSLRSHLYILRKAIDRGHDTPLLQTIPGMGFRIGEHPSAFTASRNQRESATAQG
ncbi:response regulator transcription factor [Lysobacter soli]|uniref:response regulator transcription factor n=1 Tax=Lysobacter soli TaxID=453783 RepID=UPI0024109359|nr:response regulator transcription factor [Lysobacter soli]MDG2519279.1 response regulator transcription factor [Lysobacter soli]